MAQGLNDKKILQKKQVLFKKAFLIILAFFFLFTPFLEIESTSPKCKMLKVGQVPKKLLEIQRELIFLIGYAIEKYSQLTTHALTTAHLVSKCDIGKCQKGGCKESSGGLGVYCDFGDDCSDPEGGEDICPEESRKGMAREYEKAERIANQDLIFQVGGIKIGFKEKLMEVYARIERLQRALDQAISELGSWNPKTHLLLNCKVARDLGYISTCKKENFLIAGIPIPDWLPIIIDPETGLPQLGDLPDSNIDYFICEKPKI